MNVFTVKYTNAQGRTLTANVEAFSGPDAVAMIKAEDYCDNSCPVVCLSTIGFSWHPACQI